MKILTLENFYLTLEICGQKVIDSWASDAREILCICSCYQWHWERAQECGVKGYTNCWEKNTSSYFALSFFLCPRPLSSCKKNQEHIILPDMYANKPCSVKKRLNPFPNNKF